MKHYGPSFLRTIAAVGMLVALTGWLTAARGDEQAGVPHGVQPREVVLDNGLTVLLVERHEQPTVACGLFYNVGSVNDPAGKSGIAHLFEHMMFKGTKIVGITDFEADWALIQEQDKLREEMNAEMNKMRLMKRRGEIDDVLDSKQWTPEYTAMKKRYDELVEAERKYVTNNECSNIYTAEGGAGLNAGTSNDVTIYFVQLPANKLELFLWMDSDRMANGIMREFYIERENVREERRLGVESTPIGKYNEAFEALFWQTHPYGVPVLGWASEVESITRDDVREFYKIYYAPNNATLVLVGDFDTGKTIEDVKRYFGRIPRGVKEPPLVITEEPKPIAERRFSAEAETNPRVRMRYHTVAMGHTDEAALNTLAQLLAGKTGRLYKRLVAKEDAAIGEPRARNSSRKYAGSFEINVTVKEGRTPEEVEQFVLEEIDKLREGEIADRELQKVKNQVLASSIRRLRNNTGLMFQLGLYETWYDWTYINESPKWMLAVTADDVRRVIKDYFDPKTRTVAIYRTKEGTTTAVEDPELKAAIVGLSPEQQEQTKAMVKRVKESNDVDSLKRMQEMMGRGASSDQVPEDQKAVFRYMLNVLEARIAELETSDKESD